MARRRAESVWRIFFLGTERKESFSRLLRRRAPAGAVVGRAEKEEREGGGVEGCRCARLGSVRLGGVCKSLELNIVR